MNYRNSGVAIINDYLIKLMASGYRDIELKESVSTDCTNIPLIYYENAANKAKLRDVIIQYEICLQRNGIPLIGYANVGHTSMELIEKANSLPKEKFNRIHYVPEELINDTWKNFLIILMDQAVQSFISISVANKKNE